MASIRKLLLGFVCVLLIGCCIGALKNGDVVEFYVSAKNVTSRPGGTGMIKTVFENGVLHQDGSKIWFNSYSSEFKKGPNPVWDETIFNATYYRMDWVMYGYWRINFYEQKESGGSIQLEFWQESFGTPDAVYSSCISKKPFEMVTRGGITYYYHCTKFVPTT